MNACEISDSTILVTGAAGFIGANLVLQLIKNYKNVHIVGIDNMNDYYDVSIKRNRLKLIEEETTKNKNGNKWTFVEASISNNTVVKELFRDNQFDIVVNLAAQAGVRYSITNPDSYIESNIIGFYKNIVQLLFPICINRMTSTTFFYWWQLHIITI